MNEFTPTWLYVKKHTKTNLKYFGKTIRDPLKYKGSGKYWKNHLKVHGTDIVTVWYALFDNENDLVEFATFFSEVNNIVKVCDPSGNKIWANEVPETGTQGGQNAGLPSPLRGVPTGRPSHFKGKKRPEHSKVMLGKSFTDSHKQNIAKALKGKIRSAEHCANLSASKKGKANPKVSAALKARPLITCPHCGKKGKGNMTRYHYDNCKLNKEKL